MHVTSARFARILRRICTVPLRRTPHVVGAIVVGGLFLSQLVQAAKYQKSETKVQAKQTHLTKVEPKTAEEEQTQRRPVLAAEQFRTGVESKVANLTNAAITKLKQLISVTDDSDPEKPDFFFRLAEHYRDKKSQYMFKARELDEEIYQSQDPNKKAKLTSLQKQYDHAERQWLIESIKMYLTIAQEAEGKYSKFKRMDEVLFNVADLLNQAKRHDKARIFFAQLIKNYPQSKYIPDAYLAFAEYYFNEGEIEKALKLYEQVGRFPDSPIYGYAVYKQGWCWINLKDYKKALELFVRVITDADQWAGGKKGKIVLIKEAKKDTVRAYSYVGTPDKAWPFFKRIGGDYSMTMLERLAATYYDQGKFLESITVFKQLIRLDPNSKNLCDWQYSIVKATLPGKDKRQQVVEVQRLAAVYSLSSKRGGSMKKSALEECRGNSAGVLRELATTWHQEAQKTRNNDTYDLAHYLYKEYLATFPNEKDSYVMAYYYAELLFVLEKWQEAAEAYTHVVKMQPQGKYLKEAAYAAVISWKNALNVQEEIKDTERVTVEVLKEKPIPENQQKMISAFDTYIKYVPNSPELVPIMYRKARIYYENNHFAKASPMFAEIATKHSDHELAVYSANLLLDSLNALKRYEELAEWVTKFLANENLTKNEELKTQLNKLKANLQRKIAEQMQHDHRYRECGEKYAQLANDYPDHEKWAELVYNAAICYEAAKLIGQAISVRTTLIKIKPKDPLAQKALYMIGQNYHALAWYSRAADKYEQFATEFPGEKEAPEALQNAIVFRLGRAEYDKAIEDAKLFEKNYGGRSQFAAKTASVIFSLGSIYEQRGNVEEVIKHYKTYLSKWGKAGGVDRQVVANVKMGEVLWASSCPVKGVNGACIKVTRERSKVKIKKTGKKKDKNEIELKEQCGPETKSKIVVMDRDPGKSRQAQGYFKAALQLYARNGKAAVKGGDKEELDRRSRDLDYHAAAARFYLAEAQLEEFLNVKFPKGLDFSGTNKAKLAKSNKEFKDYLEQKGKLLGKTREIYQDVIKTAVAHWAIAASARIGQLFQNFADALYTAPVPKPPVPKQLMNDKDAREEFISTFNDTYCDRLEDEAGKLEAKAVEGLGTCLQKSTDLSWYNDWSTLCEAELNQIKPAEYPLASEIRAEPGFISLKPDTSPVTEVIK